MDVHLDLFVEVDDSDLDQDRKELVTDAIKGAIENTFKQHLDKNIKVVYIQATEVKEGSEKNIIHFHHEHIDSGRTDMLLRAVEILKANNNDTLKGTSLVFV